MVKSWPVAHVNIGSNKGDRSGNIDRAVALIASGAAVAPGGRVVRSDVYTSVPWGYDSPNQYLNIGIAFPCPLSPHDLLHLLQSVEKAIDPAPHRDADGQYIDRTIDIDIIDLGGRVIDTPTLTLPHPRMHLRDFVLRPMAQIDPTWRHPFLHKTPLALLATLK